MFWERGAMQISAANLLLAGQQAKAPQQGANKAAFEAALQAKKPEAASTDGFESLLFKQSAPTPSAPAAAASSGPAQPYAALKPPGSQIDIRI